MNPNQGKKKYNIESQQQFHWDLTKKVHNSYEKLICRRSTKSRRRKYSGGSYTIQKKLHCNDFILHFILFFLFYFFFFNSNFFSFLRVHFLIAFECARVFSS